MTEAESPILVVGGRTTGLTMACELARHGVHVRVIDKSPGIDPHCRATVLHSRTLEIFQDLGIVDTILAEGVQLIGGRQYADGQPFMHARYADVDSPYPCAISLGQNRTEEVLEQLLNRLGVQVERRTELLDFTSDQEGICATVKHADGSEENVLTPWLIGCDGAHSRVRHVNGLSFPGEEDPHQYVLADVIVDGPISKDEWHGFLTDRGALYFFPFADVRTLVVADIAEHHDAATEAPTFDEIQTLVSDRGPGGVHVNDPHWFAYFRINYRVARHYRKGRIFMAGDAVHVHSPIGGLGMNTGIHDAYNLAWKLALVVRSKAPEALLDTYETERRWVGEDVVQTTRRATERDEMFSHLSAAERKKLFFNVVVPEAERVAASKHREELDLDYRKSSISVEPRAGAGSSFRSGPHAGAQAPDAGPLLVDGQSVTLFELLQGTQHCLLLFAGGGASCEGSDSLISVGSRVAREFTGLVNVFVVYTGTDRPENSPPAMTLVGDPESSLHGRYGADTACLYLIRPDGYVGYRDCQDNPDSLRQYTKQVFGH